MIKLRLMGDDFGFEDGCLICRETGLEQAEKTDEKRDRWFHERWDGHGIQVDAKVSQHNAIKEVDCKMMRWSQSEARAAKKPGRLATGLLGLDL